MGYYDNQDAQAESDRRNRELIREQERVASVQRANDAVAAARARQQAEATNAANENNRIHSRK
jgi:hypothetical protein